MREVTLPWWPNAIFAGMVSPCTLHRAPVGQGVPGPDWLAISLGFWSGRALATGTAWAGLCLIHHHHPGAVRKAKFMEIEKFGRKKNGA